MTVTPSQAAAVDLAFAVEGADRVEHAAVPTVRFALRVTAPAGRAIRSVLLDTQIQIAARRRRYDAAAEEKLFELFGAPAGWGATLRTLPWTRVTSVVPPFTGSTLVDVDVPCSYDLHVVASRYFDGLHGGEVPLEFLFSGTVFAAGPGGALQATRISWEADAEYRFPVALWQETMERYFRGTAWLRLRKDAFDRLAAFKSREALATWEEAIESLLEREA
jgi:Family of unknown function (DUF6084)